MTFIYKDTIVEANPGGEDDIGLDYSYIYNITEKLSDVIYDAPPDHGMQKGREFGTTGEHYAAKDIIKPEMISLGLYNPGLDPPYLEQMENIISKWINYDNLTTRLDTLLQGLTINESGTPTPVIDYYISPRWNQTILENVPLTNYDYDETLLTNNFTYTGLKIKRRPDFFPFADVIIEWVNNKLVNLTTVDEIIQNESLNDPEIYLYSIMEELEAEYNFSFQNYDEIGPDNASLPWYNETEANIGQDYVLIGENTFFNPNNEYPDPIDNLKKINPLGNARTYYKYLMGFQLFIRSGKNSHCRGLVLYDHNNDTYDMNIMTDMALPVIFINKSIGKPIYDDTDFWNGYISDTYTIDFHINQSYNTSVESYNIIGQINGTDSDKTIIISSYYDSWRGQGVVDGAIPMSTVLAIAKYMKKLETEYNIIPKYNIKFIAFGGEEYGFRGAYHYEAAHPDEKIVAIIDLNQLGFIQTNPDLPLTLNIVTNKLWLRPLLQKILDISRYEVQMAEDDTDAKIRWMPNGAPANDRPFARNRSVSKKVNGEWRPLCKTVCFLKDTNWTRHHRDGLDHTEGDSMKYYSSKDVALSANLIWNVTKFFTINPDCWFEGTPNYTLWDSDDVNDYPDSINVSFSLNTSMPQEHVSVRFLLYPKFTLKHPAYPILYRYRIREDYDLTPGDTSGYINVSLPLRFPIGEYVARVFLCNSTGDAILDTIESIAEPITGEKLIELIDESCDIDSIELISAKLEEIYEETGLPIINWLLSIIDVRKVRSLIIDFFAYILSDDHSKNDDFIMAPPNDPPNQPTITDGPSQVKAFELYWFTAHSTDPDGDRMRFQWNWGGKLNGPRSLLTYGDNQDHYKSHMWLNPFSSGELNVKVRAIDSHWNPNYYSPWSDDWIVTKNAGCVYKVQPQINQHSHNSLNPNAVVVNNAALFLGNSCGVGSSPTYYYNFSDLANASTQNADYTFTTAGTHLVHLNVNGTDEVNYNVTVEVVNISAGFTVSQLGAQPNQTVSFNDATLSNRSITNWTWDFGDGNISYDQNTSHNFPVPGEYNVTLNVTDDNSEVATCYLVFHVETVPPTIIDTPSFPIPVGPGCNVTVYADLFDNQSCIKTVKVNISCPDNSTGNYTMNVSENSSYDYEYVFEDTMQAGWYPYTIWVVDNANNSNYSAGCGFEISHTIGYTTPGILGQNITDRITGSNFTVLVNGTADGISAYIETNLSTPPETKCMIYRATDSVLIGTTENKTLNTGSDPDWVTYNFTGTKPTLVKDTKYTLVCWSNDTCDLFYDNSANGTSGRYKNQTYGTPPDPITWDSNESRLYSIYCSYTTVPEITDVSATPSIVGFGFNVTISADVEDNLCSMGNVSVNITYPNNTTGNFSMNNTEDDTYQYNFSDTWLVGQYNYIIWAVDKADNSNNSLEYNFTVSHLFGYPIKGSEFVWASDLIVGSTFTINENAYADNITAYVYQDTGVPVDSSKCIIYRKNDSSLIGTTEELTFGMAMGGEWITYDFEGEKPSLVKDTEYVLVVWGEDTHVYYDDFTSSRGRFNETTYGGSAPDPINFTNESRIYSIYCSYTTAPEKPTLWGPLTITENIAYTYNASTIDPDASANLYYQFDWGDNSELSDWIGPFASGATCNNATHTWTEQGYYDIKVRAKDESGDISVWSDPLPIVAPFNDDPEPQIGISPSIHNIEDFQLEEISIGELNIGDDVIDSALDVIDSASEIIDAQYRYGAKIKNIGSTDIQGYLRTIVRYFDQISEQWITLNDPVNDTTPKTINSGRHLALGPIFKGRVHTHALTNGNGNYRVYAVFGDSDGNVLKCADDTYLVAKCEFTVTSSTG